MAGPTKPAAYALLDREEEMSNAVSRLRRLTPIDVQSLVLLALLGSLQEIGGQHAHSNRNEKEWCRLKRMMCRGIAVVTNCANMNDTLGARARRVYRNNSFQQLEMAK